MKIAVFGIGGVGGYVGGMIARQGGDVSFYARGDNLRAIQEKGLTVESVPLGTFTVRPKIATGEAKEIGIVDVLFVTSKAYNLHEVCTEARPMVGPGTVVIPLLNGIALSAQMEQWLPPCIAADGIIRILCHLQAPGQVYHQTGGRIVLGVREGAVPPPLCEMADLLNAAGIPAVVSENILLENWKKYVSMCGNSTIFCWFDGPAGLVQKTPGHEGVIRAIWGELVAVAAAKGVAMPKDTVETCFQQFEASAPETVTSLYRDLCNGKAAGQTELFHLVGQMALWGKETGVPTPYHQAVWEKYSTKNS